MKVRIGRDWITAEPLDNERARTSVADESRSFRRNSIGHFGAGWEGVQFEDAKNLQTGLSFRTSRTLSTQREAMNFLNSLSSSNSAPHAFAGTLYLREEDGDAFEEWKADNAFVAPESATRTGLTVRVTYRAAFGTLELVGTGQYFTLQDDAGNTLQDDAGNNLVASVFD